MKSLDNPIKRFASLTGKIVVLFLLILIIFGFLYNYSTIKTYNLILFILILLTIVLMLYYSVLSLAVIYVYKHRDAGKLILYIARVGLKVLLPQIIFFEGMHKSNKDSIRKFYVELNNILVSKTGSKFAPEDILVLLPHCLQYSECGYKITNDVQNCKRCGRCSIGKIIEYCNERSVKVHVVTGGTAARNIASKYRPKAIIAVACERDLSSGIADVGKIPVIGIINDRPNGPCYNTLVNIDEFNKKLDDIIFE
ncbi:MAG TPA: DUF116 domain-containing protein [Acetivibrio sp.]|nr:DUF116 domain-containing protein [Acetivibrio sp.]HPT90492.1 DUF116 domain-containing protein [Acetivibrio sp.]HQA58183.1 DUF116 domain-containing protein [Acetivibrio sp.]